MPPSRWPRSFYLSDPVVERIGFRRLRFPVYPVNQHVAEKLHALTLPRDVENTRARDLVDLVWFVRHFTFRSETLAIACIATFERRKTHPWPPIIDAPPDSWTRPCVAGGSARFAPVSLTSFSHARTVAR